jgi:16S rRNA (guanine527-N7)-methyltransferase
MGPGDRALLVRSATELGVEIDSDAVERIASFLELLAEWNKRFGLTGERDPQRLLCRHVVDSLAPVTWLPETGRVVDIGTGGGFPGVVLACARPDLELVLLESRRRPISFLREVIRAVPLPNASALQMRAEDAARDPGLSGRAAVVVSRAIRLPLFLRLAGPLVKPDGSVIAMQTPRTAAAVPPRVGGFQLTERRLYSLPGGEERILLRFLPVRVPSPVLVC